MSPRPPSRGPADVALELFRRMVRHGSLDAARLMAFDFFLSLVPLLVLLGFILGRVVRRRGVEAMVGPLLETIPDAAADLARHELERLAGASATPIAPLGAVTFLWLTSSGIHTMMDVFERVTRAPARPWWKQRLIALATVGLAVASLSTTAWALVAGDDRVHQHDVGASPAAPAASSVAPLPSSSPSPSPAPSASAAPGSATHAKDAARGGSRGQPKRHPMMNRVHAPWERILAGGAVLLVGILGLAAFYRFAVEHPPGIARRAWPGTLAAMVAWIIVSWVFGSYLGSLSSYAVYYGSVAAVAVLLVWLYLTSLALLLGAEVNAMLEGVADSAA
jgi:uncharacterized BrkB/YihY/UPF0761 family membrane protein